MPQLTINGISLDAPDNATLLEAASRLGIPIPTLCHAEGKRPNTSCMLCVVEEVKQGRLLPACAARAETGMIIETESENVRHARRAALELLLSEHLGDCEAPCERACPARLNIPLMLRHLQQGDTNTALALAREALVLPAVLGRICTAPCEAGCRRGMYDDSIAIRRTHGQLGEMSDGEERASLPEASGKQVVVIGSGPAGLAAAYVLRAHGHACRVYEKQLQAGGALHNFPEEKLPRTLLDTEIAGLARMGIEFVCGTEVGSTLSVDQVLEQSDAVIVACGLAVPAGEGVFRAEEKTMPVRSIASGKHTAQSVHDYLTKTSHEPEAYFNSTMGRIPPEHVAAYIVGRTPGKQGLTQATPREAGPSPLSLQEEAARCMHCDCHAPVSCKLRQYAAKYNVRPKPFRNAERPLPGELQHHGDVIFDSGKCIRCGLCVAITREHKEALGLTFTERGFTMQLSVPFGEPLDKALIHCARECVAACPTGALAFENKEERLP